MSSAIEHKPPVPGQDVAYEYRFPVSRSEINPIHHGLLTAWFARFLDERPEAIAALLEADWANEESPTVRRFVDYLATLTPTSMVFCGERVCVLLRNPAKNLEKITIHEPRALSNQEEDFVSGFGIDGLKGFCERFYDTFEMVSPYTNGLRMEPRPVTEMDRPQLGSLEAGMVLYHVCNGDALILERSGKVGRWWHEIAWDDAPGRESRVAVSAVAESFGQFVDLYVRQMKEDSVQEVFW